MYEQLLKTSGADVLSSSKKLRIPYGRGVDIHPPPLFTSTSHWITGVKVYAKYAYAYKPFSSTPPFPVTINFLPGDQLLLSPRRVSPFLAWVDFHARFRFARSTTPEEKSGTTRSLHG